MAIFTPDDLEGMRDCSWVLREIVSDLGKAIEPGIKTRDLDRMAAHLVETYGVRSSFKGYRGYPCVITASVNEEVIDGVPGDRILMAGDVLKLQLGVENDGYYAYWADTYCIGTCAEPMRRLLEAARSALKAAVAAAMPGQEPDILSQAIQDALVAGGCEPVRQYCGHGIGRQMHEEPRIPCYVDARRSNRYHLSPGEVLAIQVLATDRPSKLKPTAGGLTVVADRGVNSVHIGAIVAVAPQPEMMCGPVV